METVKRKFSSHILLLTVVFIANTIWGKSYKIQIGDDYAFLEPISVGEPLHVTSWKIDDFAELDCIRNAWNASHRPLEFLDISEWKSHFTKEALALRGAGSDEELYDQSLVTWRESEEYGVKTSVMYLVKVRVGKTSVLNVVHGYGDHFPINGVKDGNPALNFAERYIYDNGEWRVYTQEPRWLTDFMFPSLAELEAALDSGSIETFSKLMLLDPSQKTFDAYLIKKLEEVPEGLWGSEFDCLPSSEK